jgi:hypothetical protein
MRKRVPRQIQRQEKSIEIFQTFTVNQGHFYNFFVLFYSRAFEQFLSSSSGDKQQNKKIVICIDH